MTAALRPTAVLEGVASRAQWLILEGTRCHIGLETLGELVPKQIIVYSHGFGVQRDDRGLFTDIAGALPGVEHVLFDYNRVDEERDELTVFSLVEQVSRLARIVAEIHHDHADADVHLIGHSQGCVVAAMLNPVNIRQAVFLAPPSELSSESMLGYFGQIPGAQVDRDGLTKFPRRDGSTTIVPADYWPSVDGLDPVALYNELARQTSLTIVDAQRDEVLRNKNFGSLSGRVKMTSLSANHDFTGDSRVALLGEIATLIDPV